MSKDILQAAFEAAQNDYAWNLYFIKVDKRSKQPFTVHNVRFKNNQYLNTYVSSLLNATTRFQIEPISKMQDYDGENSKVSCDKLILTNEIIKEPWGNLCNAICKASDSKINGRIMAYVLDGQPQNDNDKPITFIKSLIQSLILQTRELLSLRLQLMTN